MKLNFKGVSKATWIRVITLTLVLANLISTYMFGYVLLPFAEEQVQEGVTLFLTIIVTFWTTWKNNSFTKEAQTADSYIKDIRERNKR